MRQIRTVWLLCFMLAAPSAGAFDYKYFAGLRGGFSTVAGGDSAKFTLQENFGGSLGYRLSDRWFADLGLSVHRNYNDTTATSSLAFGGDAANATLRWKAERLGFTVNRYLFQADKRLNLFLGFGGGLMIWRFVDPAADTAVEVRGALNERTEFAASEIFFTGAGGVRLMLSSKLSLDWNIDADYLSGAGAEFDDVVKSSRDKWQIGSFISINFHFGSHGGKVSWRSDQSWPEQTPREGQTASRQAFDGDGDGVPNDIDNCLDTPAGVVVDRFGCSVDSDADGISDGLDDCPGTDRAAAGMVDIYGCPVDSDFDGVPDYLDACPFNRVGAHVDDRGCPLDTDADGVPDGLDDCPYTLYGVDVDRFGCIDLSLFSKPMVLNIDYPSGSFEIDPNSRERLKQLARILNFVPAIRLEINGYTDNIGTETANQKLSEKRARRVHDYLVAQGIDSDRIKVFGKGEANFVATNQTAEGRARNRRIEIIFYK
ncbi:MAG: OmpA family protein [Candidatus Zixiibacteriota bacterium]|nr:MAG: OmpA family protein [candidate division Zixibacteria bacterium]